MLTISLIINFACSISLWAQVAPSIEWQKSLGGAAYDEARSVQQTVDGGFIVIGHSFSDDGNVSGHHGSSSYSDYWVVKLDFAGNVTWQKSLGGVLNEEAKYIRQTTDGGYIIAGRTNSYEGDVTVSYGGYDCWIVKLDMDGNISWQKSLGGSADDEADCIHETSDGGFIVAGWVASYNGDVSGNHGNRDCWIVKLDLNGNLIWQKALGGSGYEEAYSIQQTTDGGFILGGYSTSNNGDVTGNHGESDYWIVKLDSIGNIEWEQSLGGSDEEKAYSIQQTMDGGFIATGYTLSEDGDVTQNSGSRDYWITKLNSEGDLEWDKSMGDFLADYSYSVKQTADGNFVILGWADSPPGNLGFADYWMISLDINGNLVWQKALGGGSNDYGYCVEQTSDNGFIIAGKSISNNGNVSGNHGDFDYWVVKLCAQPELSFLDADGDSFGDINGMLYSCTIPIGYVTNSEDCNDNYSNVFPGAVEILFNCLDDNCDGMTDDFEWQQAIGGNGADEAQDVLQTSDGGYIIAGYTYSETGDITESFGSGDYWIVKLNSTGAITWQKSFGGSEHDLARSVKETADGYIIAGGSDSNDGDISGNHGDYDVWIIKLDFLGNLMWEKSYGGSETDNCRSIEKVNGGFIFAGNTFSDDGMVTGNHGLFDYWVGKIDIFGNLLWQKCLGGSDYDYATSIQPTFDNGYIVLGYSGSSDGDVTGNHGGLDYWIVKLDSSGNLLWQKAFGGTQFEWGYSIKQTNDHGFIAAGKAYSNNGDVTGNHGGNDYWVVRLDSLGNLLWAKCLGGDGDEEAYSIVETSDGNFLVGGWSNSNNGDVSCTHGGVDAWTVKLNTEGNMIWQNSFGGSSGDVLSSISETTDGGLIFTGNSWSSDGDLYQNQGLTDYWIMKLFCTQSKFYKDEDNDGFGSKNDSIFSCNSVSSYVINNQDCDDTDSNIYPGAIEILNGMDDNCDGLVDETCFVDFFLVTDTLIPHHYWGINNSTGIAPLSYYWNWGDGNYDTIAYPSHIYATGGFYNICLSILDSIGCTDTLCMDYDIQKMSSSEKENTVVYVDIVPGIPTTSENLTSNLVMEIFPNPVHENLTVRLSMPLTEPVVHVRNLQGRSIDLPIFLLLNNKIRINTSILPNGFYTLQVTDEKTGKTEVQKFVKQD